MSCSIFTEGNDKIPPLAPLLDSAMRFGNLFERISMFDDRAENPFGGQRDNLLQIFVLFRCRTDNGLQSTRL